MKLQLFQLVSIIQIFVFVVVATFRSWDTIMALYKNLVRQYLKCCSTIWNTHFIKGIKLLEVVQRRAIKLVQGIEHWKYDERLGYLGLIDTFKIMIEEYDITCDLCFKLDEGANRSHDQKLFNKRYRLDIRKLVSQPN